MLEYIIVQLPVNQIKHEKSPNERKPKTYKWLTYNIKVWYSPPLLPVCVVFIMNHWCERHIILALSQKWSQIICEYSVYSNSELIPLITVNLCAKHCTLMVYTEVQTTVFSCLNYTTNPIQYQFIWGNYTKLFIFTKSNLS